MHVGTERGMPSTTTGDGKSLVETGKSLLDSEEVGKDEAVAVLPRSVKALQNETFS